MKKTKRLIGVVAFLLAALMLFSSCAISYRKVDASEYVTISSGFDFKNFKLSTEIDKMIVKDEDVAAHINKLLFELREPVKNGKGEPDVNQPGEYNAYDILTIRTYLYDKDGNLVKNGFVLGNKANVAEDGTIVLGSEEALYLGYGTGINKDLLAKLENDLFLSPEAVYRAENQHVIYNNVGSVKAGPLATIPAVGYVTYETSYTSATGSTNTATSGKLGTVTPIHFDKIAADMEKNGVGENDYNAILYLGLKALIEQQASVEGKQITPSTSKELKITVYPTNTAIPSDATFDETNVAIQYDIDFADTTKKEFKKGVITVKLQGTVDFTSNATAPAPFVTTYTYPDDATGTYKVGTTTKDLKGTECTVYTYVVERAPYSRPDYNADTVKNKLSFETDKTEDADVIAAYELDIKTRLQDACDLLAEAAAKKALLAQVMMNTTLTNVPHRNVRNYVNQILDEASRYYNEGGLRDKLNTKGEYYYDDFEDYLISDHFDNLTDANGNAVSFKTYDEIVDYFYAEGREIVKENLLAYYLADAIGCRLTDEQLLSLAKERGTVWAKEQIKAGRDYILNQNTVEKLQSSYPDTKLSNTSEKTQKEELFASWGAESYEDCLAKMLAYYGEVYGEDFATWQDYANAAYPDDAYDWEDYVEYKQGKENLYGIFNMEVVLEQLFILNENNVASAYKEIAFDASLVALK